MTRISLDGFTRRTRREATVELIKYTATVVLGIGFVISLNYTLPQTLHPTLICTASIGILVILYACCVVIIVRRKNRQIARFKRGEAPDVIQRWNAELDREGLPTYPRATHSDAAEGENGTSGTP